MLEGLSLALLLAGWLDLLGWMRLRARGGPEHLRGPLPAREDDRFSGRPDALVRTDGFRVRGSLRLLGYAGQGCRVDVESQGKIIRWGATWFS